MAKGKTTPHQLCRSPRKHDTTDTKKKRGQAKSAPEPELGTILWSANNGALIWSLLDQMQVKNNRLVLFGKNPGTNEPAPQGTKGDSKIIVYKRIGQKSFRICTKPLRTLWQNG
ncbi:hypothetical protein DFH07DRAFT_769792 [Mycena maculata]|uniref:Uncharacterized protein n=1 Tax=Mycena maculata TaxID=230809 RepID=A0AAD7NLX3_9AGAR|nr:hypothetical protein DFH07DRAFT_769792 [Mycena maculata]